MNPEELIYNEAWFKTPETQFVNTVPEVDPVGKQFTQPSNLMHLIDTLQYKQEEDEVEDVQNDEQPEEDDFSDIDDYRAIFEDDDVNTPVDWKARDIDKRQRPTGKVADIIYNTVLRETGSERKAKNALMIAQHESGFNPTITNKYNMHGLFQFSPANQRKYKVSRFDSPEKQTLAWLQYQRDNRIPDGQEGVGQLAPGYLGRDEIYHKGQKAYEANKGLDLNKDGKLTASEINNWFKVQ